jgi:hypothetical protein
LSPADPYGVAGAVYLPLEGDGDVRFNDGQASPSGRASTPAATAASGC